MRSDHNGLCARFSISSRQIGWASELTRYRDLVRIGRPVIIEKLFKVDHLGGLYLLRPGSVTTLHPGDDAHLRSRRYITVYGLGSGDARNEETKRTGVGRVSMSGCPCSVILSPDSLETTRAYTSDLGHPGV